MREISEKISSGMKEMRPSLDSSIQSTAKAKQKRERSFELSLPALVRGQDENGNPFEEATRILSISSQNAQLWLKSKVLIGTPLQVSLDIPKTILLENRLSLNISGTVVLVQANSNKRHNQLVSLQLDRTFKIRPAR